jgi:CubicO group peptidase (beta-lactamase class C family)
LITLGEYRHRDAATPRLTPEELALEDVPPLRSRHDQLQRGSGRRHGVINVPAQRQGGPGLAPDHLRATLSALASKFQVPGAQLAIHHDGQAVAVEVGELQCRTGRTVTPDTAFPIGSLTKLFTATVAMILVADGDLELDAPLGRHLPELRDDLGKRLTLRQLLSHTAGLAAGPDSADVLNLSIQRYISRYCRSEDLVLSPGTGFSYSNIGYVLIGHLIEALTGMSWKDAVESILLWPLKIEGAFVGANGRRVGRPIASGHSVNPGFGRVQQVEQSLALAEAPAGGLAVSATDLLRLGLTQLGRSSALLPRTYAEQMWQPVPGAEPFGLADGWGLGPAVFRGGILTCVGHDGNADGTACYLRVEPTKGCVVAFTCNANIGLGMWRELATELQAMGLPVCDYSAGARLGRPTTAPRGCSGDYVNGDVEYSVGVANGECYLAIDGEPVSRLAFYGDGLVFSQHDLDSGEQILPGRFLRNAITGDLDGITVGGRVGRRKSAYADRRGGHDNGLASPSSADSPRHRTDRVGEH